jgi:nucleotide-binding universal stress UspA family protein
MLSRIFVGVDGSEHGARALAVATELAVAERGRLTLMAIVPRPSPLGVGRAV